MFCILPTANEFLVDQLTINQPIVSAVVRYQYITAINISIYMFSSCYVLKFYTLFSKNNWTN